LMWPLSSKCWGYECVELYLDFPIRLQVTVLY
jgi:hypothetical protein